MGVKGIFFSLFLYTALVWIAALYKYPAAPQELRQVGLLWTGVGILSVLAFLIGARLLTWIRLWKARRAARPKPTSRLEPVSQPREDSGFGSLLQEAEATLAKIRVTGDTRPGAGPFGGLPVYLLVGPEGSGKTSTFVGSGFNPELLAGQIGPGSAVQPTRLANIWLAHGAIFVELGGRAFSGDISQWVTLLRTLRSGGGPTRTVRWWQRFRPPAPGLSLHAVFAFSEAKGLVGGVHSDLIAREAQHWQERLRAIGEVFNVQYDAHHIITKTDAVTYFDEFFSRMPESEASQRFGHRITRTRSGNDALNPDIADAEAKRLTRSFNELYQVLTDRRIVHLAYEADRNRRPAIYEFPREFKRLRPALVEFLTDAYRPNARRFGPVLCGYYLTATRDVPAAMAEIGQTRADWTLAEVAADATRLFRSEATQFFSMEALPKNEGVRGVVRRWMFNTGIFQSALDESRPPRPISANDNAYERRLKLAASGVLSFCILLCGIWIWSWSNNRELLGSLLSLPKVQAHTTDSVTLADLRNLDALRTETENLTNWQRSGAPIRLRWGLYSGNRVAEAARVGYFRRLQEIALNDLNATLVADLRRLPALPGSNAPWDPVYRGLATHIMMTSPACKPDPAIVSGVLRQVADEEQSFRTDEGRMLLARQLNYYASELPYGVPVHLSEDSEGRDHGRRYLANVQSIERVYASILSAAEKDSGKPRKLGDIAPNYASVLTGVSDVRAVFKPSAWDLVRKKSAEGSSASAGDPCVVGGQGDGKIARQDPQTQRAIQGRYLNEYAQAWRHYLSGISVVRYRGAEDASSKLGVLSSHTSPLLAALALAADETDFPAETKQDDGLMGKIAAVGKNVSVLGSAASAAEKGSEKAAELTARQTKLPADPADVSGTFQPVQIVVPPHSAKWVLEKNNGYIDSLGGLGTAMRDVARAGPTDGAVNQAAAQSYDKALDAARQLERAFNSVGVNGVDQVVVRLLEEPIVNARPFITRDIAVAEKGKVNGELAKLCADVRPVLSRFPFNSVSSQDASLKEIELLFAPGAGTLWKMQAQSLGEFVVKDGNQWKSKDPAKKPQLTQELLDFLNRAQTFSDAFFPAGATQPQLSFALRPKLDPKWKDGILELRFDGHDYAWTTSLQKRFTWTPTSAPGAEVKVRSGDFEQTAAKNDGPWGLFRIMAGAEPRPLNARQVEWNRMKVAGGGETQLNAPVRVEIAEFPGNMDLFNPKFFEGFRCPGRAVQ